MEEILNSWYLLSHYSINLVVAFIFIFLIYNRYRTHELGYVFTYMMFNTIVFFVAYMLSAVTLSVGFAFGLFAIFGIMRYRTETIPIREMTYLFGSITIGLLNGLAANKLHIIEVTIPNISVLSLAFILEYFLARYTLNEKSIIYDNLDNIKPENRTDLMADLKQRTGLPIQRVKIKRIDFSRSVVRISIYYKEP